MTITLKYKIEDIFSQRNEFHQDKIGKIEQTTYYMS